MAKEGKSTSRRVASSGALARVLEHYSGVSPGTPTAAGAASVVAPADAGVRTNAAQNQFFPRKGPATVSPDVCRPWMYADRPDSEFDHLHDLAESFKIDGQLQPALVRPIEDPSHPELRYEIIAGQVRWRAAKEAGAKLDVIVRAMDDASAFRAMVSENEFRQGLSDYSKARRFTLALERGLYKDKTALAQAMGVTASHLSYFLGFSELDPVVIARLKNVKSISARLGYALNQAVREGFLRDVLRDLPRIESGEIPRDQVPDVWRNGTIAREKPKAGVRAQGKIIEYCSTNGDVLFSVRKNAKSHIGVHISAAVALSLDDNFWEDLKLLIARRVSPHTPS